MNTYNSCSLWKVLLGADDAEDLVFWAYNFSEMHAKASAVRWAREQNKDVGYQVKSIDLLK